MKLRGTEVGNVLGASGVQGFGGEGYWFHRVWRELGLLNMRGLGFVAKTALLNKRVGNMALKANHRPRDRFPDCVEVQFLAAQMLNAVGLSTHGLKSLLDTGWWQMRTDRFGLSLMSVAPTKQERLLEIMHACQILARRKREFYSHFYLQLNLSCPNTGHDPAELISEAVEVLEIAKMVGVPLMPKFSIASAPIEAIVELGRHPACDAICVSNTIPWGWAGIDWKKQWGSDVSPLAKYGGGGLSGAPLKPLVCNWIARLRDAGFMKPINGGGGILCRDDVRDYWEAGASSIFLGSIVPLRPWRVEGVIAYANQLAWRKE